MATPSISIADQLEQLNPMQWSEFLVNEATNALVQSCNVYLRLEDRADDVRTLQHKTLGVRSQADEQLVREAARIAVQAFDAIEQSEDAQIESVRLLRINIERTDALIENTTDEVVAELLTWIRLLHHVAEIRLASQVIGYTVGRLRQRAVLN